MTAAAAGHAALEELAAGYALNALEPADEQQFLRHADRCLRCHELVAGFRYVTEALAEAAPPAEPSSRLGDRILAAAGRTPEPGRQGQVLALRSRGRRWHKPAAAAAAVFLLAGGAWGGLTATAPGPGPELAACARPHACAQVPLTATGGGRTAATLIVHDGVAYLEPGAMAANPAGEIYVLWQITGAHIPLPVGSFDVHADGRAPVRIGDLAAPYVGTWAFAVSLEHGRIIPARPSRPVALGQVS